MTEQQKREPKQPLRIPLDFEEAVGDLLKAKPPIKESAVKKTKPKAKKK